MTDGQPDLTPFQRIAREHAERSRREQGLPEKITDPYVLDRIARLLLSGRTDRDRPTG